MTQTNPPSVAGGIARSLRLYHRDAARTQRMDALNALFTPPGGLVFDIGAHVGDRVASFRRLGCRVVAVEPQPAAMRALRLMFRRDPGVTLVPAAISAASGRVRLHLNARNPTVSTASTAFIAAAQTAAGWEGQHWERVIDVPALTLNDLMAEHGVPDFVKIDVEGFEAEAIKGLSQPLPALSFEFTTLERESALEALLGLARLGDYVFNVSIRENHALEFAQGISADAMTAFIAGAPDDLNSGDIYARRR